MTKLLGILGMWSLALLFSNANAAFSPKELSGDLGISREHQQTLSPQKLFDYQTVRTNLRIQLFQKHETRKLAGFICQMSVHSLALPDGYDRFLRSSCQVKYPWQVRLLFPFHEFT